MSYQPGANLRFDDNGLLYEPDLRALVSAALEPDATAAAEAVLALCHAAWLLEPFLRGLSGRYGGGGDDRTRVLARLHEHPGGLTLAQLAAGLAPDSVTAVVAEATRTGIVTSDPASGRIRLSEAGVHTMDQGSRHTAGQLAALVAGVGTDRLAAVRHVCLWMSANRDLLRATDLAG